MSVEKDAFDELMEKEVLPADSWYLPSKAEENYYSKTLQQARQSSSEHSMNEGCQGDVQKVPIQSAKEVLETREATDWIVDQFIPRGRLTLLAGASGSGKSSLLYGVAEAISNGSDFMG